MSQFQTPCRPPESLIYHLAGALRPRKVTYLRNPSRRMISLYRSGSLRLR